MKEIVAEQAATELGMLRLDQWAKKIPQRLLALRKRMAMACQWDIPDVEGGLVSLMEELAQERKLGNAVPSTPRALEELVRQVRQCTSSVGVIAEPLQFMWVFKASADALPDLMSELDAAHYLTVVHGIDVSETTLGNRAKEHPHLKSGAKFLKSALAQAVADGLFEHKNKGRSRSSRGGQG